MRLTGKATETIVASKAQARLTMAIEVKADRSRHPGLNFSISSEFEFSFPNGSVISSIFSGPTVSCLVISEPADVSISVDIPQAVLKQV